MFETSTADQMAQIAASFVPAPITNKHALAARDVALSNGLKERAAEARAAGRFDFAEKVEARAVAAMDRAKKALFG